MQSQCKNKALAKNILRTTSSFAKFEAFCKNDVIYTKKGGVVRLLAGNKENLEIKMAEIMANKKITKKEYEDALIIVENYLNQIQGENLCNEAKEN